MKTVPKLVVFTFIELVVFGSMLFVPAGTFNYWQAWVFLVVVAVVASAPSIYLLRANPAALQRRMRGGRRRSPDWRRRSSLPACTFRWRQWSW